MNYVAALQSKKAKGGRKFSVKPRNGASGFKLNPFASEWDPVRDRAPEEDRGLFLTFALGLPLNDTEIHQFFNHNINSSDLDSEQELRTKISKSTYEQENMKSYFSVCLSAIME
ncbi:hypothetical protein K1719_039332 [Acacia pycnantha]|nr:hypothetical protein K1719_039332 [Acacia pycnantha]